MIHSSSVQTLHNVHLKGVDLQLTSARRSKPGTSELGSIGIVRTSTRYVPPNTYGRRALGMEYPRRQLERWRPVSNREQIEPLCTAHECKCSFFVHHCGGTRVVHAHVQVMSYHTKQGSHMIARLCSYRTLGGREQARANPSYFLTAVRPQQYDSTADSSQSRS